MVVSESPLIATMRQTVDAIASVQRADGCIPWVPGGKADPWNLVEAAMALDLGGRHADARRAYEWLAARQLPHGGWHAYYQGDDVLDPAFDTNVSAYVAVGMWHHYLATGDQDFLTAMWPVVEATADHVIEFQLPGGQIAWRADDPDDGALLTGSSSIHLSLHYASTIAAHLGKERPDWVRAGGRWTGTTRFWAGCFGATRRERGSPSGGTRSSCRAWGCGASPTVRG
jgi:hypothetical protein